MSRKVIYTREKIIERAFKLLKKEGMEEITARKLASYIDATPAPIYHSFKSMDELKQILVEKAKELFLKYIHEDRTGVIFLNIGLGFCIFAREESNLFQNVFLNPKGKRDLFKQFSELTQNEIKKDTRFEGMEESMKQSLFFDSWTYAYGLATLVSLGQLQATDKELEEMLMRCPGALLYQKIEETKKKK